MNAVLWLFGRFLCRHRMTNAELDWNGNTAIVAFIPKIVVSVLAIAATFPLVGNTHRDSQQYCVLVFYRKICSEEGEARRKIFSHIIMIAALVTQGLGLLSSFLCRPFPTPLSEMYNIPSPAFQWEFPPPGKCLTFFSFPPATLRPCPHYRSIYSCPHYCFDAFSTVHTKTFESDRIARCHVSWTLCACYKHTHLRWFRSSFWFGMF